MDKDHLRQMMRRQRNQMTPAYIYKACTAIYEQMVTWPVFEAAHSVGFYASIQNEVDTHRLIEYALKRDKRVSVPVTQAQGIMDFQQILSLDALQPVRFGLLEPVRNLEQVIAPQDLDVVMVPGVAFDRQGNRLGFGSGFYDRYLAHCSATRVGLTYGFQVVDRLPADAHDIQMDWLVTENEMILCGTKT